MPTEGSIWWSFLSGAELSAASTHYKELLTEAPRDEDMKATLGGSGTALLAKLTPPGTNTLIATQKKSVEGPTIDLPNYKSYSLHGRLKLWLSTKYL